MLALRNSDLIHTYVVGETASYTTESIVPTVEAVRDYVDNYLPTAGTISVTSTTDTWIHGETVFAGIVEVSTNVDAHVDPAKRGISKTAVPTVEAVYDFVLGHTTTVISATAGTMSLSGSPLAEGIEGATAGITTVARNIVVNGTTARRSLSSYTVPTVEAVYNFIHGSSNYYGDSILETADSLATIGGMTATVSGVTADSYIPGTMNVVGELVGYTNALGYVESVTDVVPTADAIVKYIDKLPRISVKGATAGTIQISGQTEKWEDPPTQQPTQGTVFVSTEVRVAEEPSLSLEAVPTVKAVSDFISGYTGTAGYITVAGKKESLADIEGSTARHGLLQSVGNIKEGTEDPNALSPVVVPTVKAVIDYIHGYTSSNYEISDSRATAVPMLANVTAGTVTLPNSIPGTYDVASTIEVVPVVIAGVTVQKTAQDCVPTAQAVVDYVKRAETGVDSGVPSWLTVENDDVVWHKVEGVPQPAVRGIVDMTEVVVVASTPTTLARTTVPTTQAVYDFIHSIDGSTARALATGSTMTVTPGESVVLGSTAVPGTYNVATTLKTTTVDGELVTASDCVPEAQAVVDWTVDWTTEFVAGYTAHIGGFTTSGTTEQWLDGQTAQAGIFGVVNTIEAATLPTGTRTLSTTNVPTVAAVKDYVDKHTPASATVGTIEIDGDSDEAWVDGYTSTAGIVQVASNIEVDTIPEDRTISTTAVPTVEAVYTYVNRFLGGSTAGYLTYDGYSHDIIVDAIVGGATVSRNIYVHREGSTSGDSAQVVPTVEAVYNFIHGTTTYIDGVALDLSDAKATVGTVGATTPPGEVVTGVTTSGCTPGTYNVVSNIVGATNTSTGAVTSVNDAVPTVKAVVEYIDGLDNVDITASTAGTLVIKGTTAVWSDSDVAVAGIVEVSKNVITGNTPSASMWAVPTVDAVYAFVHCPETPDRYRALALARTISAPPEGSTVATFAAGGKPGTCYVCTDMRGLSGEDVTLNTSYVVDGKACTLACVVPTVKAVKDYVAENAPDATYNGPFAVSGGTINGGDAYFDGVWKATAGPYTDALANSTTYWCVLKKTGSNYTAAIGTTSSTSVYEAAVPVVAIDANGVITQLHYGAVNIQGRWN
jgi:hypothetical protein